MIPDLSTALLFPTSRNHRAFVELYRNKFDDVCVVDES
jgi:hypothetical protein